MLHKNEQNASKTQAANYKKTDSNKVLNLIYRYRQVSLLTNQEVLL